MCTGANLKTRADYVVASALRYAWKLLWPFGNLCYDHGHECLPTITAWQDPANFAALALYAGLLVGGRHALAQPRRLALAAAAAAGADAKVSSRDGDGSSSSSTIYSRSTSSRISSSSSGRLLLWGLALLVVPFAPASHVLFPVGTVLGERLLYLPSAGYALLLAHAAGLLRRALSPRAPAPPPLPLVAALPLSSPSLPASPGASTTAAAAAPAAPRGGLSRRPRRRISVFLACAALAGLAGYGVALGAASVARGRAWATERALFESAMQVCPRSLKVRFRSPINKHVQLFEKLTP